MNPDIGSKALIHSLYESTYERRANRRALLPNYRRGSAETRLFKLPVGNRQRLIHTTADFGLVRDVQFSSNAVDAGVAALRSAAAIYVESNMIKIGPYSLARLRQVSQDYGPKKILLPFC